MKIALIGYGKMGKMIEEIAVSRGHEIVSVIDVDNAGDFASPAFASADVAIEFTRPDSAVANIRSAFAAGVPVVSGTTGWTAALPELRSECERGEGTLLWSSNFSVGMNIFMALNRYLTDIMKDFPQYTPQIDETHHIHKLDHPSGTAVTLADELIDHYGGRLSGWAEPSDASDPQEMHLLPVIAHREGEVPGIHTVKWDSEADEITITHSAKTRRGFALGAVMAAEWLAGKKGFHTMAEMLSDFTRTSGLFV